jgi:tetratricopeptide (TPR) repeat protein
MSPPAPAPPAPLPPALEHALGLLDRSLAAAADAFAAAGVGGGPGWRGLAHLGRGLCLQLLGDGHGAETEVDRALALWRAAGADASGAVAALGVALAEAGEPSRGHAYLEAARSAAAGSAALGGVLVEEGRLAAAAGDLGRAGELWSQALTAGGAAAPMAAANLGRLAALSGDRAAADAQFRRALEGGDGPHRRIVADSLVALATSAVAAAEWADADELLRRALPLRRDDADDADIAALLCDLGSVALAMDDPAAAASWFEEARGAAGDAADLETAALRGLGEVALRDGRAVVALAYAQQAGTVARDSVDREDAAELLRRIGDRARADGSAALSAEAYRLAAELLSG